MPNPYADLNTINDPTTGQLAPASWGDQARDNDEWLARERHHLRVYNSANISIPNTTDTAITFDSERLDGGGVHSTSSNTSRLTIVTAGWYDIGGNVGFAASGAGTRHVSIRLNGSTKIGNDSPRAAIAAFVMAIPIATEYQLAAGDYLELVVYQDSGGALNLSAVGNYSPELYATWKTF